MSPSIVWKTNYPHSHIHTSLEIRGWSHLVRSAPEPAEDVTGTQWTHYLLQLLSASLISIQAAPRTIHRSPGGLEI